MVCFQPLAGDLSAARTRSASRAKRPPQSLAASSPVNGVVKFRQVLSSFVKALLDDACCNFNALPGKSLVPALRPGLGRPTPLGPVADR
ncbi:MAG: hypothetical protein P4M13_02545 [Alphaproteobacteria bacterium]|nr:hypothetical protein [Alphaproteobacteria bacterium]